MTDYDRIQELASETNEGMKHEWFSDNIKELMNDFIEDNKNEFNDFLKNELIDDIRDLKYWIEVFCREVKEEEFNDFVNEEFGRWRDEFL